jgi:hypothetical protein
MNRSYSKIRHIQESNQKLENRLLNEEDEYSPKFKRRIGGVDNDIINLIDDAKGEVDEDDFDDYFGYMDNIVFWVVQELQSLYGANDDFWYDNEDEITDYIKDNYDDYLL